MIKSITSLNPKISNVQYRQNYPDQTTTRVSDIIPLKSEGQEASQ